MQVSHETIYLQLLAQRRERSLRSLSCYSDGVRGCGERSHAFTRDEPVSNGSLPFQRRNRTIKLWDRTLNPTGTVAAPLRWLR